jgi:hypothetical protein
MNEATTSHMTQFVFRRLTEPLKVFGYEVPSAVWLFLLAVVLVVAFFYIGWMYLRDSRGVGPWWASFLGLLRACVYVVLALVFLLPARQGYDMSETRSKVMAIFDVSHSMGTYDDIPQPGQKFESMLTRQDKVIDFLQKNNFFAALEKKNPAYIHRFAGSVDENFLFFTEGFGWPREEFEERQNKRREDPLAELSAPRPLAYEYHKSWFKPTATINLPNDASKEDRERFDKLQELNKKLQDNGFFNRTNVPDSALSLVNREFNGMVQGLIICSDGRSTQGSEDAIIQLVERAKKAHIPIFVIAVGTERPQVKIEIVDLRAPSQVQPEDRFRVVAEVNGVGLPDTEFEAELIITHVKKGNDGKEEKLPIYVVEAEEKDTSKKDDKKPGEKQPEKKPDSGNRAEHDLGTEIILKPEAMPKFSSTSPPRAEIEFQIDAGVLAKAKGIDLTAPPNAGKKWEIGETKEGEFKFQLRVPKNPQEVLPEPDHKSERIDMRVIKRPLRVLLFASGPSHEFQFLSNMLVREMDKGRLEVSIHMQPLPGGKGGARPGVQLSVPAERLLKEFPQVLEADGAKGTPEEIRDLHALSEYDEIVAFDPDWGLLSDDQLKMVKNWVNNGGGLITVAGPIHTTELARPDAGTKGGRLSPILDISPVVPLDVRIYEGNRDTTKFYPLDFSEAPPDLEFLKLDEDPNKGFLDGWNEFFYGKDWKDTKNKTAVRGFYNLYPIATVKAGSIVVARYLDPDSKMKDGKHQPFIVLNPPGSGGRVVWIGWTEMRRLRQYKEAYHERFWTKLTRFAGATNQGKVTKRIVPYFARNGVTNQIAEFTAKIIDKNGEPMPASSKPEITLTLPAGITDKDMPTKYTMRAKNPNDNDGYFVTRIQPRVSGDYILNLKVNETGDTLPPQKFSVKEANPELDNTRPDFDALYRMASPADEVLNRIPDESVKEKLRQLGRPKSEGAGGDKVDPKAVKEDVPRLYFNLENADLIPQCMKTEIKQNTSRGQVEDLWDGSLSFSIFKWEVQLPYVLFAIVGLLSVEWLTRKLLRLA